MRYLFILLLTGCVETVEVPVQLNPFVCFDGFQWDLNGSEIVNENGEQLTCQV